MTLWESKKIEMEEKKELKKKEDEAKMKEDEAKRIEDEAKPLIGVKVDSDVAPLITEPVAEVIKPE